MPHAHAYVLGRWVGETRESVRSVCSRVAMSSMWVGTGVPLIRFITTVRVPLGYISYTAVSCTSDGRLMTRRERLDYDWLFGRVRKEKPRSHYAVAPQTCARRHPRPRGLVTAQTEWSYLCLGTKHGCVLTQHEASASLGLYRSVRHVVTTPCSPVPLSPDPAASSFTVRPRPACAGLEKCEDTCPTIGNELSYTCSDTGNCVLRVRGAGCGLKTALIDYPVALALRS